MLLIIESKNISIRNCFICRHVFTTFLLYRCLFFCNWSYQIASLLFNRKVTSFTIFSEEPPSSQRIVQIQRSNQGILLYTYSRLRNILFQLIVVVFSLVSHRLICTIFLVSIIFILILTIRLMTSARTPMFLLTGWPRETPLAYIMSTIGCLLLALRFSLRSNSRVSLICSFVSPLLPIRLPPHDHCH